MQDSAITVMYKTSYQPQPEAQVVLVFVPALCMHFSCNALHTYRLDRSTDQQKILLKDTLLKSFLSRVTEKKSHYFHF